MVPTGSLTTAAIHHFLKISFFAGAKFAEIWKFAFRIKHPVPTMAILYPILIGTLLYQARLEIQLQPPIRSEKADPKPHPRFQPLYPATASKEPPPRPCAKIRGPSPYRFTRSSPFPITPPLSHHPPEGRQGSRVGQASHPTSLPKRGVLKINPPEWLG